MARVETRIDGTPNELRRLIGLPDLLPLYQVAAVAAERWLVHQVAALDPPPREISANFDGHRKRRRASA